MKRQLEITPTKKEGSMPMDSKRSTCHAWYPGGTKKDMPNRAKGAELFDPAEYAKRDMI